MSSIADGAVLAGLIERVARLTPDGQRRWGTMSAGECLAHLGDSSDNVLGRRDFPPDPVPRGAALMKWIALYSPLPWPKGRIVGPARSDPRRDGNKPGEFEQDRNRVIEGLRALAAAREDAVMRMHPNFGSMKLKDWHRWAFRHVDHHMRQFGL